ncbi:hypothetical protein PP1Y_Mpl8305 (plasmid) [Novosphingobium sp. PP1Y]|nr:hypothetical protein PP1Y_Mpl8305 [Novosphingobium sp. PP1Y]
MAENIAVRVTERVAAATDSPPMMFAIADAQASFVSRIRILGYLKGSEWRGN